MLNLQKYKPVDLEDNYPTLPDTTRVWIFQSNRPFPEEDVPAVRAKIKSFAENWVSHNR